MKVNVIVLVVCIACFGKIRAQITSADSLPALCTMIIQPGMESDKAAGLKEFKWALGSKLKVKFLDGDDFLKAKVREFAVQWSNHCSVKLIFVPSGAADIRISFKGAGSWSLIGSSSRNYSVNIKTGTAYKSNSGVTMNFGWFDAYTSDEEFQRVVVHEFGHALGLIHEHQSPAAGIPWDKKAVYAYYKSAFGWTTEMVDRNIFTRYAASKISNSKYDRLSIMHYPIPAELLYDPSAAVGWNTQLSATDIKFIKIYYPQPPPPKKEREHEGGYQGPGVGRGDIGRQ